MSLSGSNQPLVTRPINVIDVNTAFLPPHEIVKVVEKAGVTKVFCFCFFFFILLM